MSFFIPFNSSRQLNWLKVDCLPCKGILLPRGLKKEKKDRNGAGKG
jgi:hypothetical protein